MGRIISYCRTKKGLSDEEGVSYELSSIQNYANQNNHAIVKSFTDVCITDPNTNVPALKGMLQFLEENPNSVEEVVLYSIERLGRDLRGNIKTFLEIEKYVERIYFLSENVDSKHEFYKMHFLLWSAIEEKTL